MRRRKAVHHILRSDGVREMKCKIHPYECGVGVCASCLRERLLALIAFRNDPSSDHYDYVRRWFDTPASFPQPPPPHRPLSPLTFHRRSVGSVVSPAHARLHHHCERFFSTPQVGPTFRAVNGDGGIGGIEIGERRKFSILKTLFGHHRSEAADPGLGASNVSASGSWLLALIRGRRKNKKKTQFSTTAEEEGSPSWPPRRSCRAFDRGMSPTNEDDDEDDGGYSSDEYRRPTPTPMRRFPTKHRQHRNVGGFSVCLSPLVSFGPETRRSKPPEVGIPSDLRSPASSIHYRNHVAGVPTLAPNRSRKMANIGRSK